MEKFRIEIKETLSRDIVIEAEDASTAIDKVAEEYKNEKIVLNSSDFASVEYHDVEGDASRFDDRMDGEDK